MAAINITSLPKYIDQLLAYMITKPFDILAINDDNETRLDDTIHDNDHHTCRLLEICNNFQYKQLIEQQTRITKHTATMHYRSIFD